MKASIRLAALMGIPSIFVFTHDSIGLGEDGPTHQPIEQLARAARDAEPGRGAARRTRTRRRWPGATRSTQTDRPTRDRAVAPGPADRGTRPASRDDAIERGAYVLRESYKDAEPDLILIATGSEVHICNAAADLLEADGIATRVVSAPCLDRFAEQDQAYRDEVLPPACRARVSVEAASHVRLGPLGRRRGRRRSAWTASARRARRQALYEHFGFTPEAIAEQRQEGAAGRPMSVDGTASTSGSRR